MNKPVKRKAAQKHKSLVTLDRVQKISFNWALERLDKKQYGVILGHKTGFGKSFVALSLVEHLLKPNQLFLVLCPSHLIPNWKQYIQEYYPVLMDRVIYTAYTQLTDPVKYQFISSHKYRYVIIDEVHYIKNPDSKRSMAVTGEKPISSKAEPLPFENPKGMKSFCGQFISLSGSWFNNHVGDLFVVLKFLRHPLTKYGYEFFCREFGENVFRNAWGLVVKPGLKKENEKLLMEHLKNVYITADNPVKGRRVVKYLQSSKALLNLEKKFVVEVLGKLGIGQLTYDTLLLQPDILMKIADSVPKFTEFQQWKEKIALLKTKPILEDIKENIIPETKKFIIFCYNKSIVDFYFDKLYKKVHCVKVTAEVGIEDRHRVLADSDKLDECVLICTMDSVREGYNLPNFNLSLFVQSDFRPVIIIQCEGRTIRNEKDSEGKTTEKQKSVHQHYLFDDGLDRHTWKAVLAKMKTANKINKALEIK